MVSEIIDPPVSPYSTVSKIEQWLEELAKYPDTVSRTAAIDQAEDFLIAAKARNENR